jgi:dipeptidyl aminopeptidase/acylaminoacyl peptidase
MPETLPPLTADDLFQLAFVGDPRISPDGKWIAYALTTSRFDDNKYASNLYLAPAEGGEPRALTHGDHANTLPRWSPDGRTLAFVSNRHDKKQQVYLLSMEGGEARRLTDLDGSISAMRWSPDGSRLVLAHRALSAEQIARRQAKKDDAEDKRPQFQVHRSIHFKEDGMGFLFDTHAHLYVVDAASGKATRITDGDTDDIQPVFSPDGKTIAFSSNRMEDPQANLDNLDLCLVPAAGGAITRLVSRYGPCAAPAFSPDGKTLAFAGLFCEKGESFWKDLHLWTVPVGGGDPTDLTPNLDRTLGNYCISDTRDVGDMWEPPVWSPDGKTLTFLLSDSGSVFVCRIPAGGGKVERLTPAGWDMSGLSLDDRGGRLALSASSHTRPAEIAVLDPSEGGAPRLLTAHNRGIVETRWIGEPEEVWVPSEAGVKIQAWILKPPGFMAGKKYPAILEVHGGPHVQYANTFFHEMQYLAGKGFVVMWTNPRGSQGYGEAHTKAIVKDWGGPDYVDIMKAVDHLVAQGYVDETRLGITGGSYGGFMTNWVVGHTDRFKAAVTQRSVVNLYSFFGESDYGYDFEFEFFGHPWDDEETALAYLRMSPIHYVKNVTTPLLIIHSEEDHRCPISQAEELFTALKVLKKETEFVRFEGESHGLSRGGRPQNRRERLLRIAAWFERHLQPGA